MFTREEDIDAHALAKRGWSISAIARHLGRDRKTIRAYLNGTRTAGVRAKPVDAQPVVGEPFIDYITARLGEDPHLWATTLFDEATALGYGGSYPSLTRLIRDRNLRPVCAACRTTKDRPVALIEHPPGEETQWDWVELPDPPEHWGWGRQAHLLVGVLAHSGKWRGVLCESEDQAHLIAGLDAVSRALGGLTRRWRFDRMATVCAPATGRVSASFAAVAKHYGVGIDICPPFAGNRKGVVEKAVHIAAQRVWRTLPDEVSVQAAQQRFDDFCATRADLRVRKRRAHPKETIFELARAEPLTPVTAEPYPTITTVTRTVSAQALVAYAGNFYSVGPDHVRSQVLVHVRLGGTHLDITTSATPPVVLARHRLEPGGAGVIVRTDAHVSALTTAVLAATARRSRPHHRKERIPPGADALAAAAALRARPAPDQATPSPQGQTRSAVIDLTTYARAAKGRNTLS